MKELLTSEFESLQETHEASKPLMNDLAARHENVIDFCRAMRFMLNASADGGNMLFVEGIQNLMDYQESLRRVATSYHKAVGDIVKDDVYEPRKSA